MTLTLTLFMIQAEFLALIAVKRQICPWNCTILIWWPAVGLSKTIFVLCLFWCSVVVGRWIIMPTNWKSPYLSLRPVSDNHTHWVAYQWGLVIRIARVQNSSLVGWGIRRKGTKGQDPTSLWSRCLFLKLLLLPGQSLDEEEGRGGGMSS